MPPQLEYAMTSKPYIPVGISSLTTGYGSTARIPTSDIVVPRTAWSNANGKCSKFLRHAHAYGKFPICHHARHLKLYVVVNVFINFQ